MTEVKFETALFELVSRLAYPEKYASDYRQWFSGDGPAEAYFSELSSEAKMLLESREEK